MASLDTLANDLDRLHRHLLELGLTNAEALAVVKPCSDAICGHLAVDEAEHLLTLVHVRSLQ